MNTSNLPNQPQPSSPPQPPKPPANVVSHPTANRAAKGSQVDWMDDEAVEKWQNTAAAYGKTAVNYLWIPFAFAGGVLARFTQLILSKAAYPLCGTFLVWYGLLLSAEAYLISFSDAKPFVPKPLIKDGATMGNLIDAFTRSRETVLILIFAGITVSVLQSLYWREEGKSRVKIKRQTKPWFLVVGVVCSYLIDFGAVGLAYGRLGFTVITMFWAVFTVISPEVGVALIDKGNEQ